MYVRNNETGELQKINEKSKISKCFLSKLLETAHISVDSYKNENIHQLLEALLKHLPFNSKLFSRYKSNIYKNYSNKRPHFKCTLLY